MCTNNLQGYLKKVFVLLFITMNTSYASQIDDIVKSMHLFNKEQTKNVESIKNDNKKLILSNSIYYENIIATAKRFSQEFISKRWGKNNVKLSTKKTFTQYSKDMNSRENIDFENGTVTLEILANTDIKINPKEFEERLNALKNEKIH